MEWLILTVGVAVVGLTVAAVLARVDGGMPSPVSTLSHQPLPDEPLTDDDIAALRFDTGLRGYRMSQVDDVIDRLREEIAVLRGSDKDNDHLDGVAAGDLPVPDARETV